MWEVVGEDYSDGSICDFHHDKLHGNGSVASGCDCRGLTSHFHSTSTRISMYWKYLEVSVKVACQFRTATD